MKIGISNKSNKKVDIKLCPFRCPNCETLAEYVKSKYEIINILADTGDSIFSPMDEKYHEDHELARIGKVFVAADLLEKLDNKVDTIDDKVDLIQKGHARLRRDLISSGVIKAK